MEKRAVPESAERRDYQAMEGREVELIAGRENAVAAMAARRCACSSLSFGRLLAIMVMASVRVMGVG